MLVLVSGISLRILSNSYLNVFQKILTNRGKSPSVINFYTYMGLMIIGYLACPHPIFSANIILKVIIMGLLGAIGNYFIIKALSCGELSTLAPINSYKPVVALIGAYFFLGEIPELSQGLGFIFIILGTFLLANSKIFYSKATVYRFFALVFSATEAVFIKKVIMLSDISSAFLYWAISGFVFAIIIAMVSQHKLKLQKTDIKYQLALISMVALMQYSTNFVFAKMNVAYALALFQLSSVVSVFLGANIFHEEGFVKKLLASILMLVGACIILLC